MIQENTKRDTRFSTRKSDSINKRLLERELMESIEGEVRFDEGSRALYSTDASNYRQIPIGVVLPKSEEDIISAVALCKKYNAPILSRGGGTSLAGQCCNVAVVLDMSKYYNRVLSIDPENRLISVEPGIVLDHVNARLEPYDLVFGPDPATHNHCTIGGMAGNDSCGVHSVMAQFEGNGARMADNVESMTILTYDGVKMEVGPTTPGLLKNILNKNDRESAIYEHLISLRDNYKNLIERRFPDIPRRVSGYNLPQLLEKNDFNVARALVGSGGTCVIILNITLRLLKQPGRRALVVLGYPNVFEAGEHVTEILKYKPIGLEGIDKELMNYMRKKHLHDEDLSLLPEGEGWLIVEFSGQTKEEVDAKAKELMARLGEEKSPPSVKFYDEEEAKSKLWEIRESGLGATAWVPSEDDRFPGWEDSAVDPKHVGPYLKELKALFGKYGYHPSVYGHFGQGCIHCRVAFDLYTEKGMEDYKNFTIEAAHLVVKYNGSLSGEHGDGQARGDLLEIMYGKELMQAFREFKKIWDPRGMMNPGKVIDTYGQLNDLRLGAGYKPLKTDTYFKYPEDGGSFARAALRCVGVGKCRRTEGGTMCPSYMATREEEHSTRGRARILFEMLQDDFLHKKWKNEHVKDALDLCLSCKGCKGDCPVNVDMATYKSEFLSHYYQDKLRPRSAYAFGRIYWWARLASAAPGVVNFFTQTAPFSSFFKWAADVAPQRNIPAFSPQTFRSWYKKNPPSNHLPKVLLWVDTFNNYFIPDTLKEGKRVLEAAGFQVVIPEKKLCCGRPLYDFGWIRPAKKLLQQIMYELDEDIKNGTPIVGLEPSCVAVFRDELKNLFPKNETAMRLSEQVFTLSEFLNKKAVDFDIPKLRKKAMVHGHCHHKAIMGTDEDNKLLEKLGLDFEYLNSGCCGMAGYFGYEKGRHYRVSVKAGEVTLLPRVREAGPDTLIIADGFSCREQIEQQTSRKGLHLSEIIGMALRQDNGK